MLYPIGCVSPEGEFRWKTTGEVTSYPVIIINMVATYCQLEFSKESLENHIILGLSNFLIGEDILLDPKFEEACMPPCCKYQNMILNIHNCSLHIADYILLLTLLGPP